MLVQVVRYPPTAGGLTDSTDGGGGGDAAGGARAGYGVGPHSDSGLITLLVQDEVGGEDCMSAVNHHTASCGASNLGDAYCLQARILYGPFSQVS